MWPLRRAGARATIECSDYGVRVWRVKPQPRRLPAPVYISTDRNRNRNPPSGACGLRSSGL
eukprot:1691097-Heterocapsa_arctica.AAC.1